MLRDMNAFEVIAKAFHASLSELTRRLSEINSEEHNALPLDSEEQATYLENQDMFEGIESSSIQKIKQIRETLKQIAEGTYGIGVGYGADIDPKRLKAMPYATRCISCAK
jgi:DnaK suppressor protein